MKLTIWGSTNTGRSSLAYNIKTLYNLDKTAYKKSIDGFKETEKDSYVSKILCDSNLTNDDIDNNIFTKLDKDCKHFFIYRQNLLSQYLSARHNENVDSYKSQEIIDTIDIKDCRDFIDLMKKDTKRIFNKITQTLDVIVASYEEIFFSEKAFDYFDKLNIGIKKEDVSYITQNIKWEQQGKDTHIGARFTMNKSIEHFTYKKNYDIIRDMFCEEFMYIDNDTKEVKFLRHET